MSKAVWRDAFIRWRNGLLSDPRFQRWAAEFPLTRRIAQHRTQALFDLVAGFVYSQTLSACVRLKIFDLLSKGPVTTPDLARALGLTEAVAERLMAAAAALGLADRAGTRRYALGPQGAALMGNAGLMDMIEHHTHLYADLADPVALLRSGKGSLAAYWPYATSSAPLATTPEGAAPYSALMAATLPAIAQDIVDAYPLRGHRRLLDIGGGEGAFLAAAAAHAPHLELMLFDLPAVAERARARLGREGLLERTRIVAGDFLNDPAPVGADLITLVRILHDHDDAGALTLLKSVRAALPADGALMVAEPMAGDAVLDRVSNVYFAFYLLAMGRGRARSPQEIISLMRTAGFTRTRVLHTRTPVLLRAILAQP